MLEHPWTELQLLIKEKWLTQKAFSSILWKKVSEVNELLKWKRNITIQRDYLLHQTLWTPIKYWILKQIDYDYSLLDVEEASNSPLDKEELEEIWDHSEHSKESIDTNISSWATAYPAEPNEDIKWETENLNTKNSSSSLHSFPEWQDDTQETPIKESDSKDNDDLRNRAKIFRTF